MFFESITIFDHFIDDCALQVLELLDVIDCLIEHLHHDCCVELWLAREDEFVARQRLQNVNNENRVSVLA